MAEERLIQLSVQLPVSELGRLTELAGQIHRLIALSGAVGAQGNATAAVSESGENKAFDLSRFLAVRESAAPPVSQQGQAAGVEQMRANITDASAVLTSADGDYPSLFPPQGEAPLEKGLNRLDGPQPGMNAAPAIPAPPAHSPAALEDTPGRPAAQVGSALPDPAAPWLPAGEAGKQPLFGRTGAEEALISAAPAPLTAESVSLTFRRDDRRYDNGFPLY